MRAPYRRARFGTAEVKFDSSSALLALEAMSHCGVRKGKGIVTAIHHPVQGLVLIVLRGGSKLWRVQPSRMVERSCW